MGVVFCLWNGYIQGFYHIKYADYPSSHPRELLSLLGIALFFMGMFINIHSDSILRNLRQPGETGYKIPRGMFSLFLCILLTSILFQVECSNLFLVQTFWVKFLNGLVMPFIVEPCLQLPLQFSPHLILVHVLYIIISESYNFPCSIINNYCF